MDQAKREQESMSITKDDGSLLNKFIELIPLFSVFVSIMIAVYTFFLIPNLKESFSTKQDIEKIDQKLIGNKKIITEIKESFTINKVNVAYLTNNIQDLKKQVHNNNIKINNVQIELKESMQEILKILLDIQKRKDNS